MAQAGQEIGPDCLGPPIVGGPGCISYSVAPPKFLTVGFVMKNSVLPSAAWPKSWLTPVPTPPSKVEGVLPKNSSIAPDTPLVLFVSADRLRLSLPTPPSL